MPVIELYPAVRYAPFDARHRGGPAGHCFAPHTPERPAVWRWTAPGSGNRIDICEECDGCWLASAERWPDLAAVERVRLGVASPPDTEG